MGKAKTNREWWHEKVGILQAQAVPFSGIHPSVIYDKNGFWPALKLAFMRHAMGVYAPIMAKKREEGAWGSLHFVDLCAGSGLTRLNAAFHPGKSIVVTGSALVGANDDRFDHYHFVELHKTSALALEARLAAKLPPEKFTVYHEAAETAVPKIVAAIGQWKNPHFLAFVDPEGLTEVTLPALKPLFDSGRGDFMFNYQYLAVKRVLPRQATAFFGSDGWKGKDSEALRSYLGERLKAFGRPVSSNMPVASGKGPYAYDMVYCAAQTKEGNPWLTNLDSDIQKRVEGIDGKMLESFVLDGQGTLF